MGTHGRLREDGRFVQCDAGGQIAGGDLARLCQQFGGFLPDGDGVQVGDHVEALALVGLHVGELFQSAKIVAEMQRTGGLDSGEDTFAGRHIGSYYLGRRFNTALSSRGLTAPVTKSRPI